MGAEGQDKGIVGANGDGSGLEITAYITIGVQKGTKNPIVICTVDKKQAILMLAGAIQTLTMQEESRILQPGKGSIGV